MASAPSATARASTSATRGDPVAESRNRRALSLTDPRRVASTTISRTLSRFPGGSVATTRSASVRSR
ncbi:hypothetical protein [Agreia sp. Leaf283]|uniref:hypothetical protein n=1 Tax=Agreia sp. Leaf283 TaxID=1736321 RepID=UPI00070171A1|nr:hypothetical protein [Agreia sp. Leaf283]KQP55997.1 hypothetical protein ASF51_12775 [Agreia sp. Leaf283]